MLRFSFHRSLAAFCALALTATLATQVHAASVGLATDFDDITRGTTDFTVGSPDFSASFSGGTATSLMRRELYNIPPQAYVLTGAGRGGAGTVGTIEFSAPAAQVEFFAVNGGNGQANIQVFSPSLITLASVSVTANDTSAPGAFFSFTSFDLGSNIGSIVITNPGPATPPRPPYITAIDGVRATAVPSPTAMASGLLMLGGIAMRRRRLAAD